jgi:hypothetical protein
MTRTQLHGEGRWTEAALREAAARTEDPEMRTLLLKAAEVIAAALRPGR